MNNVDKEFLGSTLKALRKSSSYTTRKLAEKIGFSHSYISAVENGSKTSPSDEFIQKYLLAVCDMNVENANYFLDMINRYTSDEYNFELLPQSERESSSVTDEKVKGRFKNFSDVHIFSTYNNGRKKSEKVFEEPINDISFHLNDVSNAKFFKGIEIDPHELNHINEMINDYLIEIYTSQVNQVSAMYINGDIDKETYTKYAYKDIKTLEKLGKENVTNEQKQLIEYFDKQGD
ncbi:helix-turn-helix domain-containing protein [Staphylococcus simulans]|uniref:helix-turn-helix domain-containing protein n=1 Tax=Staphylococcus simulans TaxID=1286 RepID=UPI0021D12447|nr:helix-turn-helix transcriptional regulator [Staphylococcus simulans]UXR37487.1 helix-turn-helix domain-containing protein [Staphylococcus simulans]